MLGAEKSSIAKACGVVAGWERFEGLAITPSVILRGRGVVVGGGGVV